MAREARRDRKKETFWRRMVRGQARSRVSVRAWCVQHALREPTFYWWRTELNRRDAAEPKASFVPVRVAEDDSPNGDSWIEIVLAGDRRVRLPGRVDRQTLADVLAVLEASAC